MMSRIGVSAATTSGSVAPTENVAADASAAYVGRATAA
jgi:hypothetical protein